MNLKLMIKDGIRLVVTMGTAAVVTSIVDKSREDEDDGMVKNTLIKIGTLAIAAYIGHKASQHVCNEVDEVIELIEESKDLIKDRYEEGEA
jgi:hypothetical protein